LRAEVGDREFWPWTTVRAVRTQGTVRIRIPLAAVVTLTVVRIDTLISTRLLTARVFKLVPRSTDVAAVLLARTKATQSKHARLVEL